MSAPFVPRPPRRVALALVCAAVAVAGCRLDDAGPDAVDVTDTGAATGELSRCVVITTTEFRTDGGITVVDADSLAVSPDLTATHSDALVRVAGGRVFVVNRQGGDSIQELDPNDGFATLSQRSVGRGSNPWGITLLPDGTAWVPLYNEGALQHIDTLASDESGFLVGPPMALPLWTDADQRVEPKDAFLHDGVLYVLVQGLGAYPGCTADSHGWLHAFDARTMEPVGAFGGESSLELAACNPRAATFIDDDRLLIGHAGEHRVTGSMGDDGGIEIVDLSTGTSTGLIATESDFGDRDLVALAFDEDRLWLALAGADFDAVVVSATVEPFVVGEVVWGSEGGGVFDVEARYGRVWIADRTLAEPGLIVIDASTGERIAGPIATGYPPFDLDFVEVPGGCGSR